MRYIVFEENSGREITWLLWCHRFRKTSFSKCFSSTLKRQAGVSVQIPPVWRTFSWQISVDGRPKRSNKTGFSNLSVWTGRASAIASISSYVSFALSYLPRVSYLDIARKGMTQLCNKSRTVKLELPFPRFDKNFTKESVLWVPLLLHQHNTSAGLL